MLCCAAISAWRKASEWTSALVLLQRSAFSACDKVHRKAFEWASALALELQQAAGEVWCASSGSHVAAISACEKDTVKTSAVALDSSLGYDMVLLHQRAKQAIFASECEKDPERLKNQIMAMDLLSFMVISARVKASVWT